MPAVSSKSEQNYFPVRPVTEGSDPAAIRRAKRTPDESELTPEVDECSIANDGIAG
jgi:hypothetical protein